MNLIFVYKQNPVTVPLNNIVFTIIYLRDEYHIQTFWGEYRNLKALIEDRLYLEDFGQCGGMGRCATCMVEIEGLYGEPAFHKRNETTTLSRLPMIKSTARLSCQIEVDANLANTTVTLI